MKPLILVALAFPFTTTHPSPPFRHEIPGEEPTRVTLHNPMIRFMAHLAIYSTTSSEANDSVKLCPQHGGFKSESSCLAEGEENKQLTSFLKKHKLSKEFLGAEKTAETGMVTLTPEIVDSLAQKKKYDLAIEVTCRFCWHQSHAERKKYSWN
jgi:hypothetical protein